MSKVKGKQLIKGGAGQYKYYYLVTEHVEWFKKIFSTVIDKEGWDIYMRGNGGYYVEPHFSLSNYLRNTRYKDAIENARAYGWIVNGKGLITDYDVNKLTRNKHLLTGSELGLL